MSIVEWNAIRTLLPDMQNSSRIVVSTQQLEIASLCMEQPKNVLLRDFSTDHSVYAFFKELPKKQRDNERKKPCTPVDIGRGLRRPDSHHLRDHHHLFGRVSEIDKLGVNINTAYMRKVSAVISVCGIAGVGKSFLVGAFFDHFAENFDSCALLDNYVFSVAY
ncbi:unnamed protein product [Urochloa humidicola]